ncbi:MAG: choice-of-anchor G family protein [Casimicrobiaceae bacterium]
MSLGNYDREKSGFSESDVAESQKGVSRRAIMRGAAWTVPAVMLSTVAPAYAASLSCNANTYSTIGRGKLVSGSVFSLNLDTLVSVNGVRAKSPAPQGTEIGFDSDGSTGDYDEFANTLSITALQAIQIDATGLTNGTVTPILSDLLPANAGAHSQYSYAASEGLSKGAAGVVVDNGDVALTPNATYPDFGTLELKTLLTPLLGGNDAAFIAANVANLRLQIGAVAGRARWDVCANPALLTRDYLVNHLRLVIDSGLLVTLTDLISTTLTASLSALLLAGTVVIDSTVITNGSNGAPQPTGANPSLPIPGGSTQPIQANLGSTTTANGIAPGTIVIDLSTLMGSAATNPFGASAQPFLNGAPANSILFVDTSFAVPGSAIADFIGALPSTPGGTDGYGLQGELWSRLLDAIWISIGGFTGTLRTALSSNNILVQGVVNTVLGALNALFATVLTAILTVTLPAVFSTVFGWLTNVINITLNVQNVPEANNNPTTAVAHPGPAAWNFAPRYDVAAIGVNALSAIPSGLLALYLARGSVGPNAAL